MQLEQLMRIALKCGGLIGFTVRPFSYAARYFSNLEEHPMKRVLTLLFVLFSSISLAYAAVNLNTASVDELDAVKGIGPNKAKAIVDYRAKNGSFKSVDDLKGVKGFRAKLVEKLKSEFTVASSSPRGARKDAKAAPQPKDAKPATEAARADAGRIQEERRK